MSLRYMSRVLYQGAMRVVQGMKEQASTIKSLRDSANSSSKQKHLRFFSTTSPPFQPDNLKQTEDSLRTVMFLSCWGPN